MARLSRIAIVLLVGVTPAFAPSSAAAQPASAPATSELRALDAQLDALSRKVALSVASV